MTRGWIPAYRKLFDTDHPLAPDKKAPASKIHAWLDLCQMATHQEYRKRTEHLERGEVLVAVRYLATRWGWSKSRVNRFMIELESSTMIGTVRGTPNGTVYAIVNYDTYAVSGDSDRDSDRDAMRDSSGTAAGQRQEQKNRKADRPTKRRKSQLADDWKPHESHQVKAKELGVNLKAEVEGFRYHAKANGRTQLDWDAAFFGWMHNAVKFGRANKPIEDVSEDFVQQELEKRQKAMADIQARRAG